MTPAVGWLFTASSVGWRLSQQIPSIFFEVTSSYQSLFHPWVGCIVRYRGRGHDEIGNTSFDLGSSFSLVEGAVDILSIRSPWGSMHKEQKEGYRSHTCYTSVLDSIVGMRLTYQSGAYLIRSEPHSSSAFSSVESTDLFDIFRGNLIVSRSLFHPWARCIVRCHGRDHGEIGNTFFDLDFSHFH